MADDEDTTAWLVPVANAEARATLYVFPPGGSGAAAVRGFADTAPPDLRIVAVRLPGREKLAHLEPLRDIDVIAADLCLQIESDSAGRPPPLLYGHCAGAIIAYEVCGVLPVEAVTALVVSAHEAPDRIPVSMAWTWPDDAFLRRVADDGYLPAEVMDDPELRELVLPALRADYEAIETHVSSLPRLDCPVLALLGEQDEAVAAEDVAAWQQCTTAPFALVRVSGGHNLIDDGPGAVMRAVSQARTWAGTGEPRRAQYGESA
ncbi:thioesterase II family protein [Streptomyces sp. NPDC018045]|uniref:thioesterase II family protein n=1 Tax=Streptomyces sp. NPDC018045 TaxID=3365037 RepID=UPI0037A4DE3F